MSSEVSADSLLANYLRGFLWADDDWLDVDGASATYWQARVPQTTTVDVLSDGRTKWRIRTRIVEEIPDGTHAHQLCVALNRYAAGWSFAHDGAERTIDAIAAICAPPQWDTFFLRLSEKAKLSAWMSDLIAERLAAEVGGAPAFSHPHAQSGVRETFDGTYYYLQTLRGRPEWVMDLTRHQFPPQEDTAATIAEMVGVAAADVSWGPQGMRLPVGGGVHLDAGFARHEIAGDSWRSSLSLRCPHLSASLASDLAAITWRLFDDPQTNLLGGWTHDGDALLFQQWNTMSEARSQEQLSSYRGERSAADLWGFTSTLSDAVGSVSQVPLPVDRDGEQDRDVADRAERIVAAIAEQARAAVSERRSEGDEPADRRLLWLEHRRTIAVAAWFNPMGPTVTSTEVCALPDGTDYLVHFRRHPFAPYYCVLGPLTALDDASQIHSEATDLLVEGSLPNVLVQWDNPEATAADVPDMLRERVLEVAEEAGKDLVGDAAWIAHTMGSPWEFAAVDQSEANAVRAEAQQAAAAHLASDRGFAVWWQQVSSFDNVIANFRYLPDAWDGALNTQKAYGGLRHFDVDPLLVTYSSIGMPGPDPSRS
jgi:hypothetical protein